ncbi:MAG: AAA family ATPase [Helicobacteraceae bacterium]|nr:AAA family ATPase [Helicobacteraceae bacterium]
MELVYLWVEDYKNIKEQGFNFSPRFECKYDEHTNELTINENKEYVNIFPENINITAIVGENGSGKSTIIEFLLKLFSIDTVKLPADKCILLYKYQNKPRYIAFNINISNIVDLKIDGFNFEKQSEFLLRT